GRGVGAALVNTVVDWARQRPATALCLWVTATNDPAIALYEKCRFRRTGESKPLVHSPAVALFQMVHDLVLSGSRFSSSSCFRSSRLHHCSELLRLYEF